MRMPEIHKRYLGKVHAAVMEIRGEYDHMEASDSEILGEKIEIYRARGYSLIVRYDGISGEGLKKLLLDISLKNLGGIVDFENSLKEHYTRVRPVRNNGKNGNRKISGLENKTHG